MAAGSRQLGLKISYSIFTQGQKTEVRLDKGETINSKPCLGTCLCILL